jgi:hypothetical protein
MAGSGIVPGPGESKWLFGAAGRTGFAKRLNGFLKIILVLGELSERFNARGSRVALARDKQVFGFVRLAKSVIALHVRSINIEFDSVRVD